MFVGRLCPLSANFGKKICRGEEPESRPEAVRQPGTALPPLPRYLNLCAQFFSPGALPLQLRLLGGSRWKRPGHPDHQRLSPQGFMLKALSDFNLFRIAHTFLGIYLLGISVADFCGGSCPAIYRSWARTAPTFEDVKNPPRPPLHIAIFPMALQVSWLSWWSQTILSTVAFIILLFSNAVTNRSARGNILGNGVAFALSSLACSGASICW